MTQSLPLDFFTPSEAALSDEFSARGYVIRDVEDRPMLDAFRREIARFAAGLLKQAPPADDGEFLDGIHSYLRLETINDFRLKMYREMNAQPWFRPTYFKLAAGVIEALVGNELAMQNRINFSIQMPDDTTSLLDLHADSFTGETPYQVVEWLPLVDVAKSKSMFVLPLEKSRAISARLKNFAEGGMPALYEAVKSDLIWLNVPYGKVVVFSPNILHGNILNSEPGTRWSLNTRFAGLFTPYGSAEKTLGSYYLPIKVRPVPRAGIAYRQPAGFEE